MKILLIDLGSNRDELNEPYGIETIAGHLTNRIPSANIDLSWTQAEGKQPQLIDYDIIGLSAKLGTLSRLEYYISNILPIQKPGNIIVGGPLSTFGYLELLKKYPSLICVRGEGESTFSMLCEDFMDNRKFSKNNLLNIPNLAFVNNSEIHETRRSVENLEATSHPNRHFLDYVIKNRGIVRVENSRGCSWSRCDFCSVCEHYGDDSWRPFPINSIIKELSVLSAAGCLSPYFTDEDFFGGDYDRSKILAQRIISAKRDNIIDSKMNFFFSGRINDVLHKRGYEILNLWKKAGLRELFVGLESGSKQQLKRYGKAATPARNAKAITILSNLEIQIDAGYILFDPEMTISELIENIEYIESNKLSGFDSRSLKKIRAQPFTKTTDSYFDKDLIDGGLDLNLLCYPLRYRDSQVFDVMKLYESWESLLAKQVYILQSESRGEIPSESYRTYLKSELAKIRSLDFKVLKEILEYVLSNTTKAELDLLQNQILEQKRYVLSNINYSPKTSGADV